MANIRTLKKEIDTCVYEVISDCLTYSALNPESNQDDVSGLISEAVMLRNNLFRKINAPDRIYEHQLFETLDIAYDVNLAKVNQSTHYQETEKEIQEMEKAIEVPVIYLSNIIRDNREKIFSHLRNSNSVA